MNSKGLNISYFLFNKSISRVLSEPVLYPGLEIVSCLALDLEAAKASDVWRRKLRGSVWNEDWTMSGGGCCDA